MLNTESVKDVNILLSVINTALRDEYSALSDLIRGEDLDFTRAEKILNDGGYFYDEKLNRFVLR